ncbi:MAG: RNA polymerase factor sigma-54 [Planctomycetota bacterium]
MRLNLVTNLEQQQVLAPQMILSMDILLLNSTDLENRIEKEMMENPALELAETDPAEEAPQREEGSGDPEVQELFEILDNFERRYGGDGSFEHRGSPDASEAKQEALLNHADRAETLTEGLCRQISFLDLDPEMSRICKELIGNIDHRGYLMGEQGEIASSQSISEEEVERALRVIQSLDPPGIGARDLRECLLLQLGDNECLERWIIADHLEDLLENRLPRIAAHLQVPLAEIKDAMEIIALLNPHPGSAFFQEEAGDIIPEIFVEEQNGRFQVRINESTLPNLRISPACSTLLRQNGQNPQVVEFVRRKVEAARWLIHAIEQRRRTLLDIAQAIVDHQREFFRKGPGHQAALTMQKIADEVGVHISTVSRAANSKYAETPFGVIELRRFFSGGVERADGGIESRDNVCRVIRKLVRKEDPRNPLSDSQLTRLLQERGLDIARRTVSKYRRRVGIPAARLRKKY